MNLLSLRRMPVFDLICLVLRENAEQGILPTHLNECPLTPQTRLADLGIDSLGKLTVLAEMCGRLEIPQIDFDLHDQLSLDDLGHLLSSASCNQEKEI